MREKQSWLDRHRLLALLTGATYWTRRLCKFCGKRLKGRGITYASVCHHCGRTQPWAEQG